MVLRVDAQENKSSRIFQFVYITFDESTETQKLINRLNSLYNNAMDYPELYSTIFYLPNGQRPIVVKINLPGDNYKDFDKIVSVIQQQTSNIVIGDYDVTAIHDILAENDIIDENGRRVYRSVDWLYYICPSFWTMKNNEFVIARLFFTLEMEKLIAMKGYFSLSILCNDVKKSLRIDPSEPFGSKAICRSAALVPIPF